MARRRVNLQFLLIIAVLGIAGAVLAVAVKKFVFKENPKRYVEEGRRKMREENYVDARFNFEKALQLDPRDPDVNVRLADCLHLLTRTDSGVIGLDRKYYEQALAIDPTYRPALQKLMDLEIENVEFDPRPASFQRLRDVADKVRHLPPYVAPKLTNATKADQEEAAAAKKDAEDALPRANAYFHIATLARWVLGVVELDEVVNDEIKALVELQRVYPGNPDIPYYLANAYLKQARELKVQGRDKEQEANVLFDKAVAVFDQALQSEENKKNAVVYIRFYTVLRIANQLVSENDNVPDKANYVNRMKQILEQARKFVTKDDPGFTDVYIQSAQFALRHDDPVEAEKLMRQMITDRPDDQTARLAIADLLHGDPAKRPDMIALLKKEIVDPGMSGVMSQRTKRELELQTYLDLSKYLIEQWRSTSAPAEKKAIRAEIDKYASMLSQKEPLHPETLKLKAKIILNLRDPADPSTNDAPINAIPIIEEAINSFNVRNSNAGVGTRKDWELEFMLAQCYFDSHQTGEATARLIKITDAVPLYAPAHQLLAQLLLDNNDTDMAAEQLKILHKLTPNDPLLARLDLMLLAKLGQTASLKADIDKMPEGTLVEKKTKAQIFLVTGNPGAALRLLLLVLKEEPSDFATVDAVARIYWKMGDKKNALETVQVATEKDPSNLELDVLLKRFKGEKEEVIDEAVKAAISATKDPFEREMKRFNFYFGREHSTSEALQHLDAAEKLKPNDPKVLDLRFQFAANERKWDQAEKYIAKLAAANADQARGQIYRYRLALAKGDVSAAAEVAQDMVKSLPQYARSWLCLGDVKRMQGDYQEAILNYTNALERQSGNLDALRGVIECEYALNRPVEALRYIQQGLRYNPTNSYLREEKIKYDLAFGDPAEAVAPRVEYRDAHPKEPQAWIMLGGAYFQVAQRLTDNNKAAEAKKYIDLARQTFIQGSEQWPDEKLFYAYIADLATFTKDTVTGEKALKDLAERPQYASKVEPRLLLADYYLRGGQLDSAETAMKEAIELAKDTPEFKQKTDVQQKLAAFYVQQGKFDKALALLDENSTDQRVQLQRVETFVAADKLPDAQAALDKMLAATPRDPQLLAMRGFLLTVGRKPDEAMKVLNAALAIDPKNQTALYQRGRLFLSRGAEGVDSAINDLTTARDLSPKNVQTRLALAEALLVKGDNDACIREMTDAVKNQPGNKDVRFKLLELYARQAPPRWIDVERLIRESISMPEFTRDPDWYRAEANMWLARKDPDKAVKAMESAIKLANTLNLSPKQMGPLQQDYLNVLLQGKKYPELLANTNSLLADPRVADKVWWVYQLRAIAYRYTDQKDKALLDFDKAINIATAAKNDDVVMTLMESIAETVGTKEASERLRQKVEAGETHWRVILAYLYLKGEDYLNAVKVMDQVMADPGQMPERERDAARDIAGVIYMQAREYKKAIDIYNKILAVNPDNIGALNNLACITGELSENPQPKDALKYSKKAITILEERGGQIDGNIADTHGWMLTLAGQLDEGIKYLRTALDRQPFPECQYHLGYALLQKNQPGDAVTELEKAKKLNDDKRKKNQKVDVKLEAKIEETLTKARQLAAAAP